MPKLWIQPVDRIEKLLGLPLRGPQPLARLAAFDLRLRACLLLDSAIALCNAHRTGV